MAGHDNLYIPIDDATQAFIDGLSDDEYNNIYNRILTKLVTQNEILAGADLNDPFLIGITEQLTANWFSHVRELPVEDRTAMAVMTLTQKGEGALSLAAKNSIAPPGAGVSDTPAAKARRELLTPIQSGIFAGVDSTLGYMEQAHELVEIRFDFDKAYDYWVKTLGASPVARENMELQKIDVKRKWIDAARATGNPSLPLDYLFEEVQPTFDSANGNIGLVSQSPSVRQQVRNILAQQMGEDFPLVFSSEFKSQFDKLVQDVTQSQDNSLSAAQALTLQLGKFTEGSPEALALQEQLSQILTTPAQVLTDGIASFKTEDELQEAKDAAALAKKLEKPEGREAFIRQQAIAQGLLSPDSTDLEIKQFNEAIAGIERGLSLGGDLQKLIDEAFKGFVSGEELTRRDESRFGGIPVDARGLATGLPPGVTPSVMDENGVIINRGDAMLDSIAASVTSSTGPTREVMLPEGYIRQDGTVVGPGGQLAHERVNVSEENSLLEADRDAFEAGGDLESMAGIQEQININNANQAAWDTEYDKQIADAIAASKAERDAALAIQQKNTVFTDSLSPAGRAAKNAQTALEASKDFDPTTTGSTSFEANTDIESTGPIPETSVAPLAPVKTPEEIAAEEEAKRIKIANSAPRGTGRTVR